MANGDSLQTKQSLDGHSSAQMQHRATLPHFFAYSLDILPSVLVKWLREAVTEPYDRFGRQQVDPCPVQADVLQPITAKQSRTSARDSEKL